MISPLPSYDDELLNSAYANVSLIADEVWTFDPEDPYRKLNHSLWIRTCEVIAKYEENDSSRPRLVRDVISESRLAKYGNYEYDEQYERMYRPDDGKSSDSGLWHIRSATKRVEPWMLPEVQEYFARLISPNCTRLHREPNASNTARRENKMVVCSNFRSDWNEGLKKRRQKVNPKESNEIGLHGESSLIPKSNESELHEKSIKMVAHYRRYTVETMAEMQLHSRIASKAVRDLWNPEKFQQQYQQCHQQNQQSGLVWQTHPAVQHHQQFYCTLQPLILKTEYPQRPLQSPPPPPPPVLSAEVPEFFPKSSPSPILYSLNSDKARKTCQIRYFSSLNDRNYPNELFSYSRSQHENVATAFPNARMSILPATKTTVFRSPQELIQKVASPMQLQLTASSSSPLPICTSHRPLQMYEKCLPCTQQSPTPIPVYQRPTELYQEPTSKRKNQGVDFNNLILLTKNSIKMRRGHSKAVTQQPFLLESKQTLRTSSHNVQMQWFDKDQCARKKGEFVTVNELVSELRSFEEKYEHGKSTSWINAAESLSNQQRSSEMSKSKSGIFVNKSSGYRVPNTEERNKKKRPLYRDVVANASSGMDNIFEKIYDELEQQAMEQYRNSEESLALKYQATCIAKLQELERQAMEQYGNSSVGDEKRSISSEDQDCFDGRRCSGYGQCSPSKKYTKKKNSYFPRITLSKPKGKSLPNVFRGLSCNDNNQQPSIASKSLSTLSDCSSKKSKNICKGASGDKIDTSACTLSKRRLILMSPFERKSEARRLIKATDFRGIYSLPQARKNVLNYYQTSEIVQSGSGDENIRIIQSPGTEGMTASLRATIHANNDTRNLKNVLSIFFFTLIS
ncbi:hypothetical protein X777_13673 [Ooceraea biroi]|uniref:Uncharacterized protein n=1 Tax=Ooceraea biroi TaxID=2015173 RepID=A0A026VXW4_OOCBI|nr:hypothetical protein X777_13673 [Ooceraea biroi]